MKQTPTNDWNCRSASRAELAARRDAGLPRAVGNATEQMISTALPNYRWPAPTAALMTLCEVMTWIAFGEAVPKQRLSKNEWSRLLPYFDQTNPDGATLADSLLDRAQSEVAEASRAGKLKLIGRRNRARPDEVQTSIFWDRSVTANWWDTIEDKTHRICWTDIQCRTSEVLAIWPAKTAQDAVKAATKAAATAGTLGDAWMPAAQVFVSLRVRGFEDPEEEVLRLVRSGKLTAWLGNDADAATAWVRIETRFFVLGMTIHPSGRLTKGDVKMADYAALQNVPTGSVWFDSEDLLSVGLVTPPESPRRRITEKPRRKNWLDRFKRSQRTERRWVCSSDLAEWYIRQRGALNTAEADALYDEGCRQLFRSLLHGDFVKEGAPPHVRPHILNCGGISRMLPEQAEVFRGIWWSGQYDRQGEPVLSSPDLRELMRDVWLPACLIANWCRDRNVGVPPWLASRVGDEGDARSKPAATMPSAGPTLRSNAVTPNIAPSDKAVRHWMRQRVEEHPDDKPAPNEEDDWDAVRAHFGNGLTQREFRLVRKQETPPAWRKQGRRKPWGQAKKTVN